MLHFLSGVENTHRPVKKTCSVSQTAGTSTLKTQDLLNLGRNPTAKQSHPTLILGLVVVAGLVGDAVVVRVPPDPGVVPALAGPGISTVDDILHRQVGRRPSTFPLDVDSVCKGKKRAFAAGICGWLHTATGFETVSPSLNL